MNINSFTKITLAVAAAFTMLPAVAADGDSAVKQGAKALKGALETIVANDKAERTAAKEPAKAPEAKPAKDVAIPAAEVKKQQAAKAAKAAKAADTVTTEFPEVPAQYVRGDANEHQQRKAVAGLKKAAEKAAVIPEAVHYDQVKINTRRVINISPGENVFIPISREHPNRLLTPFQNPQVVSTTLQGGKKGECGEVCVRDGVIYITTDNPNAVTAFITEKGHEDIAFSVTMVPQAVPPREVRFELPASVVEQLRWERGKSRQGAEAWETSQPYVETLKQAMRAVALGQVPDGYTLRKTRSSDRLPKCNHPGLDISFVNGQVLEGYNLNLFVGVISNVSDRPVEFRNQRCGSWRNAAITSWPLTVLRPNQQTEIYIAVKRDEDIPAESIRKPLIKREYN